MLSLLFRNLNKKDTIHPTITKQQKQLNNFLLQKQVAQKQQQTQSEYSQKKNPIRFFKTN